MLVGRFIADSRARRHTTYAVTDQRVIVLTRGVRRQTQSIPLATLTGVSLEGRGEGGSISLGSSRVASRSDEGSASMSSSPGVVTLELASDAQRVYDLILSAQSETCSQSQATATAWRASDRDDDNWWRWQG